MTFCQFWVAKGVKLGVKRLFTPGQKDKNRVM